MTSEELLDLLAALRPAIYSGWSPEAITAVCVDGQSRRALPGRQIDIPIPRPTHTGELTCPGVAAVKCGARRLRGDSQRTHATRA